MQGYESSLNVTLPSVEVSAKDLMSLKVKAKKLVLIEKLKKG